MRIFSNSSALFAATPASVGEVVIQADTSTLWTGASTATGDWAGVSVAAAEAAWFANTAAVASHSSETDVYKAQKFRSFVQWKDMLIRFVAPTKVWVLDSVTTFTEVIGNTTAVLNTPGGSAVYTLGPGPFGDAVTLPSSTGAFAETGYKPLSTNASLGFWFRAPSTGGSSYPLLNEPWGYGGSINLKTDGKVEIFVNHASGVNSSTATSYADGLWHFVVMSISADGKQAKLIIDGEEVISFFNVMSTATVWPNFGNTQQLAGWGYGVVPNLQFTAAFNGTKQMTLEQSKVLYYDGLRFLSNA